MKIEARSVILAVLWNSVKVAGVYDCSHSSEFHRREAFFTLAALSGRDLSFDCSTRSVVVECGRAGVGK